MDNPSISKLNNYIYLGSYEPAFNDSEDFKNLGIDVIINCAKEIVYPPTTKYVVEHFPLEDNEDASMLEYMDDANKKINRYLKYGKKIYIHCVDGISRSPAILIYYLMSSKKLTFIKAYSLLKSIRPGIKINPKFERELKTVEE
ncbi:MAG: dual specificity protein phosphatase [Thermoplasmata archaeon]